MLVIYSLIFSALISACSFTGNSATEQYDVNVLARAWRQQVRDNPYNPYERNYDYNDNDCGYYPSSYKQGIVTKNKTRKNSSIQNYRKYWYYDSDEDNDYMSDPQYYPLYFDNTN